MTIFDYTWPAFLLAMGALHLIERRRDRRIIAAQDKLIAEQKLLLSNADEVIAGLNGRLQYAARDHQVTIQSYERLLDLHFATHDPTTLNQQGADRGPQYRSTIFFANEDEKKAAESLIAKLNTSGKFDAPIVTTLEPLTEFFPAEPYHQNYVCRNPMNRYVRAVAVPKVEKVQKLLKGE